LPWTRLRVLNLGRSRPLQGVAVIDDNWKTQLKKIEREFDGLPPEPSAAFKKLQSEEERRAQERAQQRVAMIGAGARLILVFALFGALAIWPYANECGWGLFGFLGAEAVIVAGGLWVAFTTWRARLPKMHTLSLLIVLVGLVLIAAEILPRTGYAIVDPNNPPQLRCAETTPAQPTTNPETKAALPSTNPLGQRVRFATQSMESRWQQSSSDLVRRLRPRQAVLERIARPELRSPPTP
jgi:hypothetical protein